MGLPIDEAVAAVHASAETLRLAAEKTPDRRNSFAERMAKLAKVKARWPRLHVVAQSESAPSFGEKIKQAAERKAGATTTKKQHAEQAAKERNRYQPAQPRPRTASD
jgi:hypothetical protein